MVIKIIVEALLCILIADFITGFVHWLEDAYGSEDWPIIGPLVIKPNILHHFQPRHFTHKNWWQSSWDLVALWGVVLLVAWGLGVLTWHLWLIAALGANANQIHKWSHRTPRENGRLIFRLQRWHIIQTPRHHAGHHTNPKNSRYCVITNLLNPVLDRMNLWAALEQVIFRITGCRRRIDPSVPASFTTEVPSASLPSSPR